METTNQRHCSCSDILNLSDDLETSSRGLTASSQFRFSFSPSTASPNKAELFGASPARSSKISANESCEEFILWTSEDSPCSNEQDPSTEPFPTHQSTASQQSMPEPSNNVRESPPFQLSFLLDPSKYSQIDANDTSTSSFEDSFTFGVPSFQTSPAEPIALGKTPSASVTPQVSPDRTPSGCVAPAAPADRRSPLRPPLLGSAPAPPPPAAAPHPLDGLCIDWPSPDAAAAPPPPPSAMKAATGGEAVARMLSDALAAMRGPERGGAAGRQGLPAGGVKRVMKACRRVHMVAGETPLLVAAACELFIKARCLFRRRAFFILSRRRHCRY